MSINETITVKSPNAGKEAEALHDGQGELSDMQTVDPDMAGTNMSKSQEQQLQNRKDDVMAKEKRLQQELQQSKP